ncbi:MAG: hypothetical protein HYR66_00460 [Sphingobacteriales bacterium]|nr:hypothetical protein [Sphingobacteriales bacterium]MBI3720736.1 hypothetical protein [Sphingobacteriales bacterium]
MASGLLHLHNLLRWVILILLLVALFQAFTKKEGLKKTSLFLMIAAHITLLIGLYQWFVGPMGLQLIRDNGMSEVMKNSVHRFFAIEHITGMIIAIILITMARGRAKKGLYAPASWMLLIALIAILVSVPWPFREGIGRPWFPGM